MSGPARRVLSRWSGRTTAWAALAVAGALLLSGCGSVNAGTAGQEAFTEAFSDDPAVAELDLGSSNDLPWVGAVNGTVVAREGIGDAELRDLVDRIGAYAAEAGGATVDVDVESRGVSFPVMSSRAQNDEIFDLAAQLRADDRVGRAALDLWYGGRSTVELTAADTEAVFALAAELPGALAALDLGGPVELELGSVEGETRIEGEPGDWLEHGEAAWRAAQGATEVTAAVLTPESVELRVAREQDVGAATGAARAALAGSALRLTVSSDLVRLGEGSTGGSARDLLAGLPDETVSLIESTWTDDEALHVTAVSLAALPRLAKEIAALPGSDRFSTIALKVMGEQPASGALPPFEVYADPAELPDRTSAGLALARTKGVDTVQIARGRVEIALAGFVAEERAGDYAGLLKAAARVGDWSCLDAGENGKLCTEAQDAIALADVPNDDHPGARAFVEAWNAAPPVGEPPRWRRE